MTSMTGYAYNELLTDEISVIVEMKSVNARFLDLSINIPPFLGRLESEIRKKCSEKIVRGKVDVYIRCQELQPKVEVIHNVDAAREYFNALNEIAKGLGKSCDDIPLSLILEQDGVLTSKKECDIDRYKDFIDPILNKTLETFCSDRNREGENLKKDILLQVEKIEHAGNFFKSEMPKMEDIFKANVQNRFEEMLGNNIDEQRIATEVASLLVRYTINEEVVRLLSHLVVLKKEILENPHPGKKLDFLCQELNREINTIGSKSQLKDISNMVIVAKEALENVREQAKNVE